MTTEPLTPNPATADAAIASAWERGLLIAMLIMVLLGTGAMLLM